MIHSQHKESDMKKIGKTATCARERSTYHEGKANGTTHMKQKHSKHPAKEKK